MTAASGNSAHPDADYTDAVAGSASFGAAERIRLARENLCLAMSLFAASHQGLITTSFVTPSPELHLPNGEVVDYSIPLELNDNAALVRSVGNQIRGAFALSVLQTNRELESWFHDTPIPEERDPDLQIAREVIYLLARSVESNLIAPVWRVPPEFRRPHSCPGVDFALDATDLDGREIRWEHFDGLPRYLDLTLYLAQRLDGTSETAPEGSARHDYGPVGDLAERYATEAAVTGPPGIAPGFGSGAGRLRRTGGSNAPDDSPAGWIAPTRVPEPRFTVASQASEAGPVAGFVEDACTTGVNAMTLASDLYTSYAHWCLDNGYLAVSQRKFGLDLRSEGYQRKRRGKGRHWWVGLRATD